jgi:cytochrome P450
MAEDLARATALPDGPIAAVTHPDPYPYYARLVARHPFHYDPIHGLWVAASADACRAVLTSELCGVRPQSEPVPAALLGTPVGEIFGRLVRMTDGVRHAALKHAASGVLGRVAAADIASVSERWAVALVSETGGATDSSRLYELSCRLPAAVIAALLGIDESAATDVATPVGELSAAMAPAATAPEIARGSRAVARLLDLVHSRAPTDAAANTIGFLIQAHDATAGLIGNALVALAADPMLTARLADRPALVLDLVCELARHDAPIQNTRRHVHRSGSIAGVDIPAAARILVILAAANRDPAANPDPDRLDLSRPDRRTFTFGLGPHACPGALLATTIAAAGIRALLAAGFDPRCLPTPIRYRASANARIPIFDARAPWSP